MEIKEFRKKYKVNNTWLAKVFGYANVKSYNKSAGKRKIEEGICRVVEVVEKKIDPSGK